MSAIISDALKHGHDLYICSECAEDAGGVWPEDHVATFSVSKCDVCGKETATCALSDWNWPGKKTRLDREL